MNKWIGKWLITVAILHLLLAFIFLGEPLRQILSNGTLESGTTGKAVWYFVFSILLLAVVVVIDSLWANNKDLPIVVTASFLVIVLSSIFLAPISGFWLALPPALYLVFTNRTTIANNP